MLIGKHLIAGNWVAGETTFENTPVEGDADVFATGSAEHVNAAVEAAEEAFWSFGYSSRASRAKFLRAIADQIESRGDEITAIGTKETGLPAARLNGERGRTVGQLKLFADHIEAGEYLDRRHDEA
ncbi:MAG: aldehyde dehydrogenase family protein, partial [Roseibium sp.]